MEPKQEKWINDILDSVNSLQRAEPSPFLFAKIRDRLNAASQPVYVPARTVWLAAASFTLLALLNWQLTTTPAPATTTQTTELNTVATEMQLYPATNQLYDVWNGQNY
ncbi:hypothetical protein [Spirosoma linguale]|uniref:Uncharacterized protein n=1 Tax=Spirosoma linguale (strain ATCC 33905 / DSM 74 / LMG 10896 / Claus 1) TaxID=504472 RepID=D2QGU2_SPILD|nr:hypothetical protein Slin_5142 [Spirosoma linguale DSM 74]